MGFCNCSMFSCALLCVLSSFAIISIGEKRAGCFASCVFLVPHDCCVALPCDAIGLSAVCDYGISGSYAFTIFETCPYRSLNRDICSV